MMSKHHDRQPGVTHGQQPGRWVHTRACQFAAGKLEEKVVVMGSVVGSTACSEAMPPVMLLI